MENERERQETMTIKRRILLTIAAATAIVLAAGCGGGNKATSEGNGRLADVSISPVPGATFISRNTEFTFEWSGGFEPPATFFAHAFELDSGGSPVEIPTSLVRDGDAFRWFLRPTSALPSRQAVYVELSATNDETLDFSYISDSRAASVTSPALRPGGEVATIHQIHLVRSR